MFTDPKAVIEYGGGTLPILFQGVTCTGIEQNLLECDHSEIGSYNDCYNIFEQVGVSCGKLHTFARYCMLYQTLSGLK